MRFLLLCSPHSCRTTLSSLRRKSIPDDQLSVSKSTALCMCSRFAACSKTIDCGPSATAASTSSSRRIGRQCMKTADGRAAAISDVVTL